MTPLISEIQTAVCAHYGLELVDMSADRRGRRIARPRQVAMYLVRRMTERSYPEIGRKFGDRDHATIIHGVRKIEGLLLSDAEIVNDVRIIRSAVVDAATNRGNRLAVGDGVSGD